MDAQELSQEFFLFFYFSGGQRLAPFLVCITQPQSWLETLERWRVHYKVGCMGNRTNKATSRATCASITPPNKPSFPPCSMDSVFFPCNAFLKTHRCPQYLFPSLGYCPGKQQGSTRCASRVGACSSRPCGSVQFKPRSSSSAESLTESSPHTQWSIF